MTIASQKGSTLTPRTRVLLAGISGWIGSTLGPEIARSPDMILAGGIARRSARKPLRECAGDGTAYSSEALVLNRIEDMTGDCDVFVDFTRPEIVRHHALYALQRGWHVVIGTSGLSDSDYAEIDRVAREGNKGVLAAGNFSITAVLLQRFAEQAARHIDHFEIVDYAHADKPDAPSGTARELAHRLGRITRPVLDVPLDSTRGDVASRGATLSGAQVHSVRLPGFIISVEAIFGKPHERLLLRHDAGTGADPYVAGCLLAIRKVAGLVGLQRGLDSVLDL